MRRKIKVRKKKRWMKELLKKKKSKFMHKNLLQELLLSAPADYENYLCMNKETFMNLLGMTTPLIQKMDTKLRDSISACERFSSTLRFLATGQTFQELMFTTAISPPSLGGIVMDTCSAICTVLKEYINILKTTNEWLEVARAFERTWQFPHCIGAIDGKHVQMKKPIGSGSYYFNYKHTFSIVLMAVVNTHCEFMMADVGANGRVADGVFANTKFGKKTKKKKLRNEMQEHLDVEDENDKKVNEENERKISIELNKLPPKILRVLCARHGTKEITELLAQSSL
ncbi:uncharacterized protein [Palaemon carinicauda]|uniref:uncharacterized protein n=1 Tax=Palaemon carinicauda TaxID=392227 RepID=UPI0035B5AFDB